MKFQKEDFPPGPWSHMALSRLTLGCSVFPALSEDDHRSQRNAVILGRANGKCQAATAGQARDVSASVYRAVAASVVRPCLCSLYAHQLERPILQRASTFVCSPELLLQAVRGVPGK